MLSKGCMLAGPGIIVSKAHLHGWICCYEEEDDDDEEEDEELLDVGLRSNNYLPVCTKEHKHTKACNRIT
jgi:hypothetical protein